MAHSRKAFKSVAPFVPTGIIARTAGYRDRQSAFDPANGHAGSHRNLPSFVNHSRFFFSAGNSYLRFWPISDLLSQ